MVLKGWSKDPGPPRGGGIPRHFSFQKGIFILIVSKKILSCFIDESGDFGPYDEHSPFYYVAVVLHDQDDDITVKISNMEERAAKQGLPQHAIHSAPLIRRENVYANFLMEERKHLFNILYYFAVQLPIKYFCVKIDKSECYDGIQQTAKISRSITTAILAKEMFWRAYDKIIVYYDNGQTQLTRIITSVFNTLFINVEMRKVRPADYKLFQVADLICTLEMLGEKAEHNSFTKSEMRFFGTVRNFKKDYYKKIKKKKL